MAKQTLPKHVAIVMDGNGRWAKQRKLPRAAGHRAGAKSVRRAIEFSIQQGIEVLTLFALSVENLKHRPKPELQLLTTLLYESLLKDTPELHQNNVRIRIIGDHSVFDQKLQQQIAESQAITAENTGLTLVLAINYSGRWDMTQAAQQLLAAQLDQDQPLLLDEEMLGHHLCLHDLPEPDLLIRTSGEQRISNFMLWQFAYTELFFTPAFWPDFDATVYEQAITCYQQRERRFGLTGEQVECQNA